MLAWKDWSCYAWGQEEEEEEEEAAPFSRLQQLVVRECPSLVGALPCRLDLLMKLEIRSCPYLNSSTGVAHLPSLQELYLEDCNKEILKCLANLTSLIVLRVQNLAGLVCFDHEFTSRLVKLKELDIGSCDKLTYLWDNENETENLTCLREVSIGRCPQFISFVAGERQIGLPNLERMRLRYCESLEELPRKMHSLKKLWIEECPKIRGQRQIIPSAYPTNNNPMSQLAALKELVIWECQGVESLEEIAMESLESLWIDSCENLRSLPRSLHKLSHLTELVIRECPELEIEEEFPLLLPITLSSFTLDKCPKIKSIAIPNNLTHLDVRYCRALEMEEFPPLPITLSSFILENCRKIKRLPNQWHHLTSLREIFIRDCPNIDHFPKGGFPPNLRRLGIRGCENVKEPVREWGLSFLTSLDYLWIDGMSMGGGGGKGEKFCFPSSDEDDKDTWSLIFPSSLTSLQINNMRNVERLSSGLRSHLSFLTDLQIHDCPKLRDLPEDGLPPSLHYLRIVRCSILKERCSKLTGRYWPLIQHIPLIQIVDDWIQ